MRSNTCGAVLHALTAGPAECGGWQERPAGMRHAGWISACLEGRRQRSARQVAANYCGLQEGSNLVPWALLHCCPTLPCTQPGARGACGGTADRRHGGGHSHLPLPCLEHVSLGAFVCACWLATCLLLDRGAGEPSWTCVLLLLGPHGHTAGRTQPGSAAPSHNSLQHWPGIGGPLRGALRVHLLSRPGGPLKCGPGRRAGGRRARRLLWVRTSWRASSATCPLAIAGWARWPSRRGLSRS